MQYDAIGARKEREPTARTTYVMSVFVGRRKRS